MGASKSGERTVECPQRESEIKLTESLAQGGHVGHVAHKAGAAVAR